jgi:hypothetical protein
VAEGIGGGRGPQRMRADPEAELHGVGSDEHINAIRREGFVESRAVTFAAERRSLLLFRGF